MAMRQASRSAKRHRLRTGGKQAEKRAAAKREKAVRINGLSLRQHAFLREKILGMNDKDAALAAGYAPSVAVNTKQKIWTPEVVAEFERLKKIFARAWRNILAEMDAAAPETATPQPAGT